MVTDEAVEYAFQLASEYWPGLPREDFDEYFAVGAEAAVLLETFDDVLAGMGYRRVIEPDGHFGIGAWRKS